MVFEVLGENLLTYLLNNGRALGAQTNEPRKGLNEVIVKRIIKGSLMGLVEIHDARIIHTDLKPEVNNAFDIEYLDCS